MRFETRLIKSNRTRTIASRHPVMFLKPITAAYTVTFGDRAENETGMQMIGHSVAKGISVATLSELKQKLQNVGVDSFIKQIVCAATYEAKSCSSHACFSLVNNGPAMSTVSDDEFLDEGSIVVQGFPRRHLEHFHSGLEYHPTA